MSGKKKQKRTPGKNKSAKKKPEEKKPMANSTKFIIFCAALVVIFLGVVFIPQLIHNYELEQNIYNNFEFIKRSDGYWYTVVQKGAQPYQIPFYYHPSELEDIPVDPSIRGRFFELKDNNGSIFITIYPDSEDNRIVIAGVEIARITGGRYDLLNVPTSSAFIKEPSSASADTGTPIVTCADADNDTMVIWITLSDNTIAYAYDNCIILEAETYEDMIRVADRTMYHLLGIME